jgi:hypothetical protein
MSRNNGVLPYFFDNPCALIIGGKFLGFAPVLKFTLLRFYPDTMRAHDQRLVAARQIENGSQL